MKPLIFDFKVNRHEMNSEMFYEYDMKEALNVVYVNGQKKPFIDVESNDLELLTKTKMHRENDDDNFLFEPGTKTEVRRERNDPNDTFLELTTKTFTKRERDDEGLTDYQ